MNINQYYIYIYIYIYIYFRCIYSEYKLLVTHRIIHRIHYIQNTTWNTIWISNKQNINITFIFKSIRTKYPNNDGIIKDVNIVMVRILIKYI